jgi:PAS domain S-box-containing protein
VKSKNQTLPTERDWFAVLVALMAEPVAVVNESGTVRHVNPPMAELLGAKESPVEHNVTDFLAKADRTRVLEALRQAGSLSTTIPGAALARDRSQRERRDLRIRRLGPDAVLLLAAADESEATAWAAAAQQAGRTGSFAWSLAEDRFRWSAELRALYGAEPVPMESTSAAWMEQLHPADAARIRREIAAMIAERGTSYQTEVRGRLPGEREEWLMVRGRIDYDAAGTALRMLGVQANIDELQREQRRSNFILQMALTLRPLSQPSDIADTTVKTLAAQLAVDRCAYCRFEEDEDVFEILGNRATGLPPMTGRFRLSEFGQEVVTAQRAGQPYVVADAATAPMTAAARALFQQTGIRAAIAVPLIKDGHLRAGIAVHHATPREWSVDEIELVELAANACWESIERARVVAQLEASERRLRLALTSARMVAWEVDPATGKADVLENAAEVFGLPADTHLADTEAGFGAMHPDDVPAHRERFARTLATGGSHRAEFRMLRRDGQGVVWVEEHAFTVRNEHGQPARVVGIMMDITHRKLAEDELRTAHALLGDKAAHLEALVQQRTAKLQETIGELEVFSYSVAHDLRAPLRSLQGFADILLTDHASALDLEGRAHLERIARAARRMDRLTLDVLNYSRVVRGDAPLEAINVAELLEDLLKTYTQFAPGHADIRVVGPLPLVQANAALLTQVFSNLLQNAVKFVAPGTRPVVRVTAEAHDGVARFKVADNGLGIAGHLHERIFGMFERLDPAFEGTGIGLAIVKRAVERMGGRVGVESATGAGSTFWFELPAAPPAGLSKPKE